MPIYQYQKVSDEFTTYTIQLSQDQINQELATIDGVTYHYVDGELPEQFEQITVTVADLTPELKAKLQAQSRVFQLISKAVIDRIRSKYSLDAELYLARIAIGAQAGLYTLEDGEAEEIQAFGDWAEECRAWGRSERAKFGL